jgi:hypothetical protein
MAEAGGEERRWGRVVRKTRSGLQNPPKEADEIWHRRTMEQRLTRRTDVAEAEAVGGAAAVGRQDKSKTKEKERRRQRTRGKGKKGEGGGRRTNPPPLELPQ